MANEIVKYRNIMNRLQFYNFTETDLDLLMAICAKVRDIGVEVICLNYDYIMDIIKWDRHQSIDLFHKSLMRVSDKLRHVGGVIEISDGVFDVFNLFTTFKGEKEKRLLTVKVNEDFKYILNDLTSNFTKFELAEYISLDGRYAKMLYQRLKQFRRTGWWNVSLGDIQMELDIPKSYKANDIVKRIIKPSVEAIKGCKGFSDLEVEEIRSRRRGRAIEGFIFRWTAEKQIPGQLRIEDILRDAEENPKKRKKSKNPFNDYPQTTYDFDEIYKKVVKNRPDD